MHGLLLLLGREDLVREAELRRGRLLRPLVGDLVDLGQGGAADGPESALRGLGVQDRIGQGPAPTRKLRARLQRAVRSGQGREIRAEICQMRTTMQL